MSSKAQKDGIAGCLKCGKAIASRGLCNTHYDYFVKARRKIKDPEQRKQYEESLMAAGLLRESRQGSRSDVKSENDYERLAKQFIVEELATASEAKRDEEKKRKRSVKKKG